MPKAQGKAKDKKEQGKLQSVSADLSWEYCLI